MRPSGSFASSDVPRMSQRLGTVKFTNAPLRIIHSAIARSEWSALGAFSAPAGDGAWMDAAPGGTDAVWGGVCWRFVGAVESSCGGMASFSATLLDRWGFAAA